MKRNLLYVDDQRENLVVFRAAFANRFNILEATCADEALELFGAHEIPVLVADQRMPDMTGVELCEIVRREHPHAIRMILTGYSDSDAMMEAINKGHVYNFITKPWDRDSLFSTLVRGFEAYDLAVSNNALSERLHHADRCAKLGRCAAGMAHEMGNQLFVLPLVDLIEREYADHEELMAFAQIARTTQDRLKELIDEVKDFVRKEDSSRGRLPTNLAHLAREAVSLAGMHESVPKTILKLDVQAEPLVCCCKAKIQQVVFNLVKNAADALAEQDKPEIRVTVSEQDDQALLSVHDNGPGINPEHLEGIWEPFFSTKGDAGTGLGLDLCREMVTAHGGTIECESQPGQGATFIVRLPLAAVVQAA
jgi:signal transduction histidine kinase